MDQGINPSSPFRVDFGSVITTLYVLRRPGRPDWLIEKMFPKLPLKLDSDWINTQGKGVFEIGLAKMRRVLIHISRFDRCYNSRVLHAPSRISQICTKVPTNGTLFYKESIRFCLAIGFDLKSL